MKFVLGSNVFEVYCFVKAGPEDGVTSEAIQKAVNIPIRAVYSCLSVLAREQHVKSGWLARVGNPRKVKVYSLLRDRECSDLVALRADEVVVKRAELIELQTYAALYRSMGGRSKHQTVLVGGMTQLG